jgi:hypothetical protein
MPPLRRSAARPPARLPSIEVAAAARERDRAKVARVRAALARWPAWTEDAGPERSRR